MEKWLRVEGPAFCVGIIFTRTAGVWRVSSCARYVARDVAGRTADEVRAWLARGGWRWQWLPDA